MACQPKRSETVVIHELLAFVQQKLDVMDQVSLEQILMTSFTEDEIIQAKKVLADSAVTQIRLITRHRDGRGVTLQKKWKNIRDAYNKEFKKGKSIPSGSGACKGSKYMYFDRLSFLQKTVENKETTSNIHEAKNEGIQNIDQNQDNFVNAREIQSVPNKRKKIKITSEERLADILENSIESRDKIQRQLQESMSKQDDDDKLFCMSLYKELKKSPRK
ncbi:unnamed protein product [Parnassius mnemosyne]|uniref:MADF domain-containing protein n=1 Tax=Parnassius mnemosyne TaxID=213953 RepID=A0AAV1KBF7_9NEOP